MISSYYAFQDTKTPLRIQSVSFTINIILNLSLVWFLKHSAIALSSAVSAMITFFLLGIFLKKHKVGFPWSELMKKIFRMSVPFLSLGGFLFCHQIFLYSSILNYLESIGIDYVQASRIHLSLAIFPAVLIFSFSVLFLGWTAHIFWSENFAGRTELPKPESKICDSRSIDWDFEFFSDYKPRMCNRILFIILLILPGILSAQSRPRAEEPFDELVREKKEIFGSEKEEKYPIRMLIVDWESWEGHSSWHAFWFIRRTDYPKYKQFRIFPLYNSIEAKSGRASLDYFFRFSLIEGWKPKESKKKH